VLYGNVGAADRLDFTVVGPAVNEVACIEALCEPLGHTLLTSAELRRRRTMPTIVWHRLVTTICVAFARPRRFSVWRRARPGFSVEQGWFGGRGAGGTCGPAGNASLMAKKPSSFR
jgi:hypothetical protein